MASVLVALAVVLGALAAATAVGTLFIARRFPPNGRFVEVDGVRLHCLVEGPADDPLPVLLLHGASASLDGLRLALGPALAGRRLIWVDRPGHGHSARGGARVHAPAVQAALAAGLLDRLGVGRAVVVAHSLGASVAAAMAVEHPARVAGLVLLAPATHAWPGGVTWYYRLAALPVLGALFTWTLTLPIGVLVLARAIAGVFAPDPAPPDYAEAARAALVLRPKTFRANAADVVRLKPAVTAMAPRYRTIAAPTAIVTGDADAVVWPHLHSEGLARDVPGAELTVLPGVGHMPHHVRPDVAAAVVARVTARASTEAAPVG